MFDVGFTELMFIGVIALVVIGPERLPAVARTAGTWVNKMQRFVKGVKSDFASEFESGELKKLIGDQREQIDELRQMVDSAKKDIQDSSQEIIRDANKSMSSLESSVKDVDVTGGEIVDADKVESEADTSPVLTSETSVSNSEPANGSGNTSASTGTGSSS